ncbi:cryptochrome/photolyase family protein [Jannaschia sp. CCS1]|uniref:cryptochrome/photolyase family protein n=1 Tax=Jannaschia sp. (strain CCS1) TaxID=290400 RepID=UPI000053B517|nr:deoxyribodipyrimidine photo-lyase [Jannaschia sp. CCS1]ABD54906.1 deoxyribodipyrimidine photo-lyase type I [Jannaschia sp. CCS1]
MTTIYWVRRDFRLSDNPALVAACERGAVVPLFICDEVIEGHGAAPKWRLGLGVEAFAEALHAVGSKLILRRGDALPTLRAVIADVSANAVHWNRLYDPDSRKRDEAVKAALKEDGVEAISHKGHVLFEPWTVETKTGGYYKVYTPFWKMVRDRSPGEALAAPKIPAPDTWPASDDLSDWHLGKAMNRGAEVVAPHLNVGEQAAQGRLGAFIGNGIDDYADARDNLAKNGTSLLSENLAYGEISARQCWHAGQRAMADGKPGAETFLKEVVWRDFAYHLVHHTPRITTANWREEWEAFPWNTDPDTPEVTAWKQGRTGMAVVDAAMREMYVTGRMHNRARMLVASYLTKHLMTDWKIGMDWFEECLVDWDPASNAMGWQWSAGSGPDATPYFRVFNPETQAEKFDKAGRYRMRWLAEITGKPQDTASAYFDAVPRAWGLDPTMGYPSAPIVTASEGRKRALDAYENRGF